MDKSGGGDLLLVLFFVGLVIWFLFFKIDYKDVWWKGTANQLVRACGSVGEADCENGGLYFLPVKHKKREGSTHTFEIIFNDGKSVETQGYCLRDESGQYGSDRYCYTTSAENMVFLITK